MIEIFKEYKYGVLGTIAFHLVIVILFLLVKISTTYSLVEEGILIDFESIEIEEEIVPEIEETEIITEQGELGLDEGHGSNIPVNVAERNINDRESKEEIEKRINELTRKYLSPNQPVSTVSENNESVPYEENVKEEEISPTLSLNAENDYKGASNVYYNLSGRRHRYLPIPVYKCEREGEVVVEIIVNKKGYVISARIEKQNSVIDDNCFYKTAMEAALNTKFNTDFNAPIHQKGSISYHFIAQ